MPTEVRGLDEQQIQNRVRILDAVDDARCVCGTRAMAVADDANWFIDSYAGEDGTEHAVLRCPWCW